MLYSSLNTRNRRLLRQWNLGIVSVFLLGRRLLVDLVLDIGHMLFGLVVMLDNNVRRFRLYVISVIDYFKGRVLYFTDVNMQLFRQS